MGVPRSSRYHNTKSTLSLGSGIEISHGRNTGSPWTALMKTTGTETKKKNNNYKLNQPNPKTYA